MTPTIPESLIRLSRAWPTAPLTAEAKTGYAEACLNADPRDVADAVWRLTTGRVSRAYPELIPPPGALAAEILKSRNARLDDEARNRPRLSPPDSRRDAGVESRKDLIARLKAENGGCLIQPMKPDEQLERDKLRKQQEAIILAAFEGDEEAIAAWRAENMARGIAARAAVEAPSNIGNTDRQRNAA